MTIALIRLLTSRTTRATRIVEASLVMVSALIRLVVGLLVLVDRLALIANVVRSVLVKCGALPHLLSIVCGWVV